VGPDGTVHEAAGPVEIESFGEHHAPAGETNAAKIVASDGEETDYFGYSSQMNDHGVIVVGAHGEDDKGDDAGAVYVYTPTADGYQETKLLASDGAADDIFGRSTAINNAGVIAVGAYLDDDMGENSNSGSVYVFTPTEGGAYEEVKLTASDGVANAYFGSKLSINEDGVVAVSAAGADTVYVFTPDGSGGYTETKLIGSDATVSFGTSLTIHDDGTVFAGDNGAAYIFSPDGEGGYTETKLVAPDTADASGFGKSGVIEADGTILVGASNALYLYEPDGNGNYGIQKISNTAINFGSSVAVNDTGVIVAGASGDSGTGAVYVYVPDGAG
ncbi:FG-GAP repeat protein, partial [Roseibium sp. RKSG952]|uniref:FG-GAP repeat protein n=1 Tax=Roseibium sp. RKSG952 TaxID=2529384 RepID=UPI0013CBA03B